MSALAADTGFTFADTFPIGLLFVGLAVFAAVGAMSHEHERAFSASLIYLGLGAVAAAAIQLLDIEWIDPFEDAEVLEHVAEVALIFALFSSGLKLDRSLRWREWGSVVRLLAIAMPLTIAGVALFASQVIGLSLGAAVLLGAVARAHGPGARGRHRRRAARRRGGARAELRAHRGGRRQRRPRGAVRAARHLHRREGRHRLGRRVAAGRRPLRRAWPAWRSAPRSAGRRPGACTCCATASCSRRRSTATTRSPPRSSSTASPRRPAATASSPCSPAASRSAATSTTTSSTGASTQGAEQVEKFMELARDPAARLAAHRRRADRPGLGGLAARGRAAGRHPPGEHVALARRLAGRDRGRPLVRRLVRRARRRHPLLRGDRRRRGRALRRRGEARRVDRDRVRDRLDRRPRRDRRARAAPAVPGPARGRARQAGSPLTPRPAPEPATPPAR